MSNSTDLKKLWSRQEAVIPDTKELFKKVKKFKTGHVKKIIVTNVLLLSTAAFIANIWYRNPFETLTSALGIAMILLAILMFLFVYNQLIPLFAKTESGVESSYYLQQLLKIKEKQLFIHGVLLNVYFVLLSAGIFMYMIEPASGMTRAHALLAYGLTALWIALNWFFIRPRTVRKQQAKINELIEKFKALNSQLMDNV